MPPSYENWSNSVNTYNYLEYNLILGLLSHVVYFDIFLTCPFLQLVGRKYIPTYYQPSNNAKGIFDVYDHMMGQKARANRYSHNACSIS